MKKDFLKFLVPCIVLLVLSSSLATIYNTFDDLNTPYGISACDNDDTFQGDDHHLVDTPAPFRLTPPPVQAMYTPHENEAAIPIESASALNHISRAPPALFS